jgi:hypothetical protein
VEEVLVLVGVILVGVSDGEELELDEVLESGMELTVVVTLEADEVIEVEVAVIEGGGGDVGSSAGGEGDGSGALLLLESEEDESVREVGSGADVDVVRLGRVDEEVVEADDSGDVVGVPSSLDEVLVSTL